MNTISINFWTFLSAGFLTAVFHALLPNHWLPFIAAGRFHNWAPRKLFIFTLTVAIAHAVVTIALSALVVFFGEHIANALRERTNKVTAVILLLLGIIFISFPNFYGHRHIHHHECEHGEQLNQTVTMLSLFLALTLSPCEGLLFLLFGAAMQIGLVKAMTIAFISGLTTVVLLVSIVMFIQMGLERVLPKVTERHERFMTGSLLILLGILTLFIG